MRLNQITLPATDVVRAREFYIRLGFTLIVDSPPSYVRLLAPVGDTTLSLHRVASMPEGETAIIYLETDALDEDVARLKGTGLHFHQNPRDEPWLWREARLFDPDRNEICLYRAGENRLHPPWRVS